MLLGASHPAAQPPSQPPSHQPATCHWEQFWAHLACRRCQRPSTFLAPPPFWNEICLNQDATGSPDARLRSKAPNPSSIPSHLAEPGFRRSAFVRPSRVPPVFIPPAVSLARTAKACSSSPICGFRGTNCFCAQEPHARYGGTSAHDARRDHGQSI